MTDNERVFKSNIKALDGALTNALSKLADQGILHMDWSSDRDWPVWEHWFVQDRQDPPETARVTVIVSYHYPHSDRAQQPAALEFTERIEIFQMGTASKVLKNFNGCLVISEPLLRELESEIQNRLQAGWEKLKEAGWMGEA